MVPEGWTRRSFGELFDFKNGYNTEKSDYGSGTPFINVSEVLKNEALHVDQIPGQVRIADAQLAAFGVKRGDILLNRTSETPDEVGFTTVYLDTAPVIFGGFVIRARPLTSELVPEFCRYAFRQPDVREQIIRRSQGAIRSNIGQGELSQVSVALPPLAEQQKIAEILGTWGKAIETTEALLANARTQKRALMQSLLTGTRRFPGFEDQPWREVRLGDVCDTWSGGTPSRLNPDYFGGTIPWIKSGEVNAARVLGTEETITEKALKDSAAKMVEPETVLVAMYGATAGVVSVSGIHAAINQAILAVKARTEVNQTYLLFAIQGKMEETKRLTQGGQPNLNAQIIRAAMIGMPSEAEQIRIAEMLMHAEAEVSSTAISLDHLRTEKKSLMQQLLTGKRRVVV